MEMLYHYLWKHKMFGRKLTLTDGRPVEVLSPGLHNNDAGPDFSHARVRIDGTDWAGNVEIHVKASDWHRHGHDNDPAYDSIVLHVVAVDDKAIHRRDGSVIPQAIVTAPPEFFDVAARLTSGIDRVRCLDFIPSIPHLTREDWLESLGMERIHSKAGHMLEIHRQSTSDWRHTIFVVLARALGFGLNGLPFELTAKSLPLNFLARHSDNPMQIEALLFGQAAMLDSSVNIFDEYYQTLCREYYFLARKYGLRPIQAGLWKYSRTRPQNFPHRRLAILASALSGDFNIIDRLIEARGQTEALSQLFSWKASEYWHSHASFGMGGIKMPASLSRASINLLLINVAAPFYFAYGSLHGDVDLAEAGVKLLCSLPAENNSIISAWISAGLRPSDAMRSQALLQLRKEYCNRDRCLSCRFGYQSVKHSFAR